MSKIQDVRNQMPFGNPTRPISAIKKIARHHSATTSGDVFAFLKYWQGTLGWKTGGYHEVILRDGTVQLCYNPSQVTNGVKNHNTSVYNICVVGNGSFTAAQEKAFNERAKVALELFNLKPSDVLGHREFSGQSTECPGINMNTVRSNLQEFITPKPVPKPVIKESEPFMLELGIVIHSVADYAAAERIQRKTGGAIFDRREAEKRQVAKEVIIVGGGVGKIKGKVQKDLSGATLFDTYANVGKFLK